MQNLYQLRKRLHQNPELAFEEHKTSAILMEELAKLFHNHKDKAAKFKIHRFQKSLGILVEYTCNAGSYRLFRADMDALPVFENTDSEYPSLTPGLMHACGHDIHMSILMGLIDKCLAQPPKQNLLFLFQPAEEGKGGALSILSENIIQSFDVQAAIALHVASEMPVGSVSSRAGVFFGIPQEFDVRFIGKSAHVAFPEKGIDAISPMIHFATLMQKDIAKLAKTERVIYHIGKVQGGSIRNVIADSCILEGTHRSLNSQTRDKMNQLTLDNAQKAAKHSGADFQVDLLCSYDAVVNNAAWVEKLKQLCNSVGIQFSEAEIAMTGEDFGFFSTLYPGLLFWLGSGCSQALHSPGFFAQNQSIDVGVKIMWELAKA